MLNKNDPQIRQDEYQQFTSENSVNSAYVNNDSDYAPRPSNVDPKELDDDTIYENMIFPS